MPIRLPPWIHLPRGIRLSVPPSWRIPLSLRWKLLAALGLILIPSLILVLAADLSDLAVRRADIVSADRTTANTVASLVDASIDDAVAVGQAVATAPSTQTFDTRTLDPRLQSLRAEYLQFLNITVVNARGESVGEMVPYAPGQPRISVADRPYFRQTMEFNTVQVSPILIGRHPSRPTSIVSVPIRNAAGRPIGAVLVSLNLEYFRAKLWSVPLGAGRVIVITDSSGNLAFASDRWSTDFAIQSLANAPLIRDAVHGIPASQESGTFPLLSGQQLGAAVPSPRYSWVAAVLEPASAAQAPVNRIVLIDIASFVLALILGTLAVLYLSNQIISPILALESAARSWSSGDLGVRVSIRTGDELERLGDSLDAMAASLSQTLDQLAEADARLTRERNRLSAILQTSPSGIVMIDTSEKIVLVNPAADALTGTKRVPGAAASQGSVVSRFYRPNGTPYPYDELPLVRALREGIPMLGVELIIRRPNGWETHVLVNAAPIRESNGRILGAVAVFSDITPLVEEERLRREFVVSAAHEFRHPLTVIKGYAEVAERNPTVRGTPVCRELDMIVDAADRASKLANQLLQSAQVHLPPVLLHYERVDLAELAKDTVAAFKRTSKKRGYDFDVKTEPAEVEGDPQLLGEALTDLLQQAEDAMPQGGKIGVCVSAWDGIATAAVVDHGPEVPPEAIPSLFRPFGVVPSVVQETKVSRPSLLLYLAKRIVEESGGWIRAESSPAQTTISFSLPRRPPSKPTIPNGRNQIAAPPASPTARASSTSPGES